MTPQLVELYKTIDGNPKRNVEIILIDYDINQRGMDKYLTKSKINFPGLKQAETESNFASTLQKIESSLPAIVLADANGKVLQFATGKDCSKVVAKVRSLMQ